MKPEKGREIVHVRKQTELMSDGTIRPKTYITTYRSAMWMAFPLGVLWGLFILLMATTNIVWLPVGLVIGPVLFILFVKWYSVKELEIR